VIRPEESTRLVFVATDRHRCVAWSTRQTIKSDVADEVSLGCDGDDFSLDFSSHHEIPYWAIDLNNDTFVPSVKD
jgi:hypothetical protein